MVSTAVIFMAGNFAGTLQELCSVRSALSPNAFPTVNIIVDNLRVGDVEGALLCLSRQAEFSSVIVMQRNAVCFPQKLHGHRPTSIDWSISMPQELRLQGKKALVTGSDTGIGHEIDRKSVV